MAVLMVVESLLCQLSVKSAERKIFWGGWDGPPGMFSMLIMGPMFERFCSDSMAVSLMYVP